MTFSRNAIIAELQEFDAKFEDKFVDPVDCLVPRSDGEGEVAFQLRRRPWRLRTGRTPTAAAARGQVSTLSAARNRGLTKSRARSRLFLYRYSSGWVSTSV